MGLFDYVKADHEKFGELKGEVFQTKDFDDPYMEHYTINEAGRLIADVVRYENQSDPTAKPGSIQSFAGCMTPVKIGEKDMNWHGYLRLGDVKCKFTDGNLIEVIIPQDEPLATPNGG